MTGVMAASASRPDKAPLESGVPAGSGGTSLSCAGSSSGASCISVSFSMVIGGGVRMLAWTPWADNSGEMEFGGVIKAASFSAAENPALLSPTSRALVISTEADGEAMAAAVVGLKAMFARSGGW